MGPLGWTITIVLGTWVIFGKQIAGRLVSPRKIGVTFLNQLLAQRGYPPDTVPNAALDRLVDWQIQQAPQGTGSGARAVKDYLGAQLPGLAVKLIAWLENDPALDAAWREVFTNAGIPQRSRP